MPPPDDDDDEDELKGGSSSSSAGLARSDSQRVSNDDIEPSPLKRSNSQISLVSVAAADVVSADVVEGQVRIFVVFVMCVLFLSHIT